MGTVKTLIFQIYQAQREKLTEPELKRKVLEYLQICIYDVRKYISAWKKD